MGAGSEQRVPQLLAPSPLMVELERELAYEPGRHPRQGMPATLMSADPG